MKKSYTNKPDKYYYCSFDPGDGESGGSFAAFKNDRLVYFTIKIWKAKLYIWFKRIFNRVIVIKEQNIHAVSEYKNKSKKIFHIECLHCGHIWHGKIYIEENEHARCPKCKRIRNVHRVHDRT